MHATGAFTAVGVTIYFLCVISNAVTYPTMSAIRHRVTEDTPPRKCCVAGYAFNEDLECVHVEDLGRLNYTMDDTWRAQQERIATVIVSAAQGLNCHEEASASSNHLRRSYAPTFHTSTQYCVEKMTNGTSVLAKCPPVSSGAAAFFLTLMMSARNKVSTTVMTINRTSVTSTDTQDVSKKEEVTYCSHGLSAVVFWGAQTYMGTNVAHVVLCIIVVAVYLSVPELGKKIYNRAVLRHNVCLLLQGSILTFLAFCDLCECPVTDNFTVFLWIALQYFTNATGFWLNVICFDMTLSITRFRWMAGTAQRNSREEYRRLLIYGVFAWGSALIPAVVALILEYVPGIPEDFPLKPNYRHYRDGPNIVVNLYFFGIPLLTLFWNNVLFVFTTYKIVRIQRSTEIATRGQNNALRKKYFLFLQLYLLMGSPWFFGSLLACLNNLVILKVCRLVQPILWLLMLVGHKKLRRKLTDKLRCFERRTEASAISS
ncbi:PREDICTED: G-protein coupled receptor Mth2-like [Dinoponera quadriceps]|uniref:G-protein coupled receptor Mth2-like n=1 Tax=Dinoponera quadriceps TaxID=609295 RepID=A0A6P3XCT3_DINQU|nr:PREDICTED: G-protein coupled receptor Mth2-like [Dinoponera quadriceps]